VLHICIYDISRLRVNDVASGSDCMASKDVIIIGKKLKVYGSCRCLISDGTGVNWDRPLDGLYLGLEQNSLSSAYRTESSRLWNFV